MLSPCLRGTADGMGQRKRGPAVQNGERAETIG
jgi:hypothetical protein